MIKLFFFGDFYPRIYDAAEIPELASDPSFYLKSSCDDPWLGAVVRLVKVCAVSSEFIAFGYVGTNLGKYSQFAG